MSERCKSVEMESSLVGTLTLSSLVGTLTFELAHELPMVKNYITHDMYDISK